MGTDIHFSPLALTHALPFLPLAQGDIDYQVDRRGEPRSEEHTSELQSRDSI